MLQYYIYTFITRYYTTLFFLSSIFLTLSWTSFFSTTAIVKCAEEEITNTETIEEEISPWMWTFFAVGMFITSILLFKSYVHWSHATIADLTPIIVDTPIEKVDASTEMDIVQPILLENIGLKGKSFVAIPPQDIPTNSPVYVNAENITQKLLEYEQFTNRQRQLISQLENEISCQTHDMEHMEREMRKYIRAVKEGSQIIQHLQKINKELQNK